MNYKTSPKVLSSAGLLPVPARSGYHLEGNRFAFQGDRVIKNLTHTSGFVNALPPLSEARTRSRKALKGPGHTLMGVLPFKATFTSLAGPPVPALPGYRIFSLQWWPAEWSAATYIAAKVIAAGMLMQPSPDSRWTRLGAINIGCRPHKAISSSC